jgi:hypothetical protein
LAFYRNLRYYATRNRPKICCSSVQNDRLIIFAIADIMKNLSPIRYVFGIGIELFSVIIKSSNFTRSLFVFIFLPRWIYDYEFITSVRVKRNCLLQAGNVQSISRKVKSGFSCGSLSARPSSSDS